MVHRDLSRQTHIYSVVGAGIQQCVCWGCVGACCGGPLFPDLNRGFLIADLEWDAVLYVQAALGELTYESEAAEKMRGKLRNLEAAERAAREEAAIARAAEGQARAAAQQLAQEVEAVKHGDASQQERERRLQVPFALHFVRVRVYSRVCGRTWQKGGFETRS
jgi:hypothetical protein